MPPAAPKQRSADNICVSHDREHLITEINKLLKENEGSIKESEVCERFGIGSFDIPWGHNIGWARIQKSEDTSQKYWLVSSNLNT